jgi:hypothetical protein
MANSSSVNTLVTEIRQRVDRVNATNLNDAAELKPWVKQSAARLYEIMVSRWKDWYTISSVMSLTNGVSSYPLPADFRAMGEVYMFYQAGNVRRPLSPFTKRQRGQYNNPLYLALNQWPLRYQLQREKIIFDPAPTANYTNVIELNYIPQYSSPVSDDVPLDPVLPNGWEEWIVLDVCIKIAQKFRLQDMAQAFTAERKEIEKNIVAGAAVRDAEAPMMTNRYDGNGFVFGAPSGPAVYNP